MRARDREDWAGAEALAREALTLAEKVGRREVIAYNCYNLAQALVRQGKRNDAVPYARRSLDVYTQLGMHSNIEAARKTLEECEA